MKVADLQKYFSDLAKLLHATDGKKSAAELVKIAEGLEPFREYGLADFAGFLARAEDYARTGILPVVAPKATARPKAPPKPKADLSALRTEVERLYGSAASPAVTIESIDELRLKLDKLNKADLGSIAQVIDLVGMSSKPKAVILDAIVGRIRSIKQSALRTSIIDRPGTHF
jgi:hypothetical protein